ncbi:MAG TPA: hypothetical protein PLS26_12905, partial [Bacteroidales bacterium]|nr:hypothetical protein [Bacteroidales bacterium]
GEVKLRFQKNIGRFTDYEDFKDVEEPAMQPNEAFYEPATKIVQSKINKKSAKKTDDPPVDVPF